MPSLVRDEIAEFWHQCARIRREDVFGLEDALRPNYN